MVEGVTQLGQDAVVSRYHRQTRQPLSCSMDPAQKVGATIELESRGLEMHTYIHVQADWQQNMYSSI